MLIINKSLKLSLFIVFYFATKYLIMLGKVADQGPHTNCTSHSLTSPRGGRKGGTNTAIPHMVAREYRNTASKFSQIPKPQLQMGKS